MTELSDAIKEIHDIRDFMKERAPDPEELKRMSDALADSQKRVKALEDEKKVKRSEDGKIKVREGKFAGYSSMDFATLEAVLRGRPGSRGSGFEARLLEDMVESRTELRKQMASYDAVERWEDGANSIIRSITGGNAKAARNLKDSIPYWRQEMMTYLPKAMDSTTAGSGDELVPTFETAELWMDVNLATNVLPALRQIPMPTNPYDVPLQFGDVNWYPIDENVEGTTTDAATAKSTLTAQGLKAGIPFSDELNEDSIVPFIPNLRASLVRNAAEVLDDVILNADTTTVNGINSDGATISSSSAGKAHWLLGWDGLRHLPLVDNTGQGVDVNADITAANTFIAALRKLGKYAAAQVMGDVVFISNVGASIVALGLDEVETVDKLGIRATISTGELANIYGKPIIVSEQMRLADADGKVTDAGNSEENGSVLAVNTSQWYVGFRRGITLETQREAGKGQTTLWASMRPALVARGTRSSATHTSLAYNITNVG